MPILFVILFLLPLGAAHSEEGTIQQARALALKKNRVEACRVLKSFLETQSASNKAARTRVMNSLSQISKLFFTDKGQKIFESGQASMWESPDLALSQFREALALEDNNVQILNNLARVQLMKQDCEGALQSVQLSRKVDPYAGEAAVLELRAFACKGDFESLRDKAKSLPALDASEDVFLQYLLALDSFQQRFWQKTSEGMFKLTESNPQFPESYFLLAKSNAELGKNVEPYFQKYISLCKSITARERKRYSLEPRLCANLKEAEDELAKNQNL